MAFKMTKALAILKKSLDKSHGHLTFEYKVEEDVAQASASINVADLDDEVSVFYDIYANGIYTFRAVFDKIEKTPENLALLNDFNGGRNGLCGFIRDDGYLEFDYTAPLFAEKDIQKQGSFILNVLIACAEGSEEVRQLAKITK
jgi:hypothetical protein